MGFLDAIRHVFSNYAVMRGRARRSEYWYFWLFNFIISYIPSIIVYFNTTRILGSTYSYLIDGRNPVDMLADGLSAFSWIIITLVGIYSLVAIIPNICVSVRRLHDTGRSGWFYLLNFAHCPVILLGIVVVGFSGSIGKGLSRLVLWCWLAFLVMIISQIVLLIFLVQDSQPGTNQYGENPKDNSFRGESIRGQQLNDAGMSNNYAQRGGIQYGADPYAFSQPQKTVSVNRMLPQSEPVQRNNLPQIIGLRGPCQGQAFEMDRGQNTYIIGRDPKVANIIVTNKYVGRNHCSVMFNYDRDTFCVIDNSTNGVFDSSGHRLQTQRIYEFPRGSAIRLVNDDIEFLLQ